MGDINVWINNSNHHVLFTLEKIDKCKIIVIVDSILKILILYAKQYWKDKGIQVRSTNIAIQQSTDDESILYYYISYFNKLIIYWSINW